MDTVVLVLFIWAIVFALGALVFYFGLLDNRYPNRQPSHYWLELAVPALVCLMTSMALLGVDLFSR